MSLNEEQFWEWVSAGAVAAGLLAAMRLLALAYGSLTDGREAVL